METNFSEKDFFLYLKGDLEEVRKKALLEWLEADPENLDSFSKIKAIYNYLEMRGKLTKYEFHRALRRLNNAIDSGKPALRHRAAARFAGIFVASALVVALGFFGVSQYFDSKYTYSIDTFNGKARNVLLEDGTQVWLSPHSSLSFNKKKFQSDRKVEFEGEAVFDVASNPARPFVVNTSKISIKVLGTEFKVRSYSTEDYSETTLARGMVDITDGHGLVSLSPGQKATVVNGKIKVENVDVSEVEMMTYGIVSIVNAPLSNIIQHLEEEFEVKLRVVSNKERDNLYTFNYGVDSNIADIIDMLETISGAKVEIIK